MAPRGRPKKMEIQPEVKGDCPADGCNSKLFSIKSTRIGELSEVKKGEKVEAIFCSQCGRQIAWLEE